MRLVLTLCLLSPLAACIFDEEPPCDDYYYETSPPPELRNPETGFCEQWWNPPACDECPCPIYAAEAPPTWGYCWDSCESLGQADCAATNRCRMILDDTFAFQACWPLDQTGPIEGSCQGAGAERCSMMNHCAAVHDTCADTGNCGPSAEVDTPTSFLYCMDEDLGPSCFGAVTCQAAPPVCDANQLPEVQTGCYTGNCIDAAQCEPAPDCSGLEEDTCILAPNCDAMYQTTDCVCDQNGCDCEYQFIGCVEEA